MGEGERESEELVINTSSRADERRPLAKYLSLSVMVPRGEGAAGGFPNRIHSVYVHAN